jgi:lysophospholipase L1-like esterase
MKPKSLSTLFTLALAAFSGATHAADPAPATDAYLHFKLPAGETPFLIDRHYPTCRMWDFRHSGDLGVYTTANSIGPENAMLFYLPRGGKPGTVLMYDIGVHDSEKEKTYSDNKGICFWIKGDGGDGDISIGTNWDQSKNNPLLGTFPLSDKSWKKIFVPWDKFSRPIKKGFYFINFKLNPKTDRECYATVTRLALYKDEQTEQANPPKIEDPAGMIPAEKFVNPAPAEAQKLIPNTMQKLNAKKPLTIVVAGDSITAGAQLWYMNPQNNPRHSDASIYRAIHEKNLATHFGYDKHRFVFKNWVAPSKKNNTPGHFDILTGQTPEADGSLPFVGLQIIGVGAGGQDTNFSGAHMDDITQLKPDLVIWAYGANDATNNRARDYRNGATANLEKLKAQNTEIILASITPWLNRPYFTHSAAFRDIAADIAKNLNIPMVDQFGAFMARGDRYRGDLYSDQIHPNEYGHQIMAATLSAAFGLPDQFVWNRPLFKSNILKELPK